ncbi:lactate utilization protein C [Zhouia sp. PK063]|uniref:lactate utilization protein C n=1 Tax=Zhouia sp. PK063 TaxID=3373602 RepID=UPI003797C7AB
MGKAEILQRIQLSKPEKLPLPQIDISLFEDDKDKVNLFKEKVAFAGGTITEVETKEDVNRFFKEHFKKEKNIINHTGDIISLEHVVHDKNKDPHELDNIDVVIYKADVGVAENGAIWLDHKKIRERVLPFITKHLVILLNKASICRNMHEAYDILKDHDFDFGVFISGPSKTADIEQSLVIGAHGALSFTIILFDQKNSN